MSLATFFLPGGGERVDVALFTGPTFSRHLEMLLAETYRHPMSSVA